MFLLIFLMVLLEFFVFMLIEKFIFGQDIVDVVVSNGFLVVMYYLNKIRFYNLWEIMENYSFFIKLGKICRVFFFDNVYQETYFLLFDGSDNLFIVGE